MSDEEIERAAVEELLQEAKKAEEASLPKCSKPQSIVNKRLYCPSLASTLRHPILPKPVSKRKYVGLDEPNFDEDVKKRPDAGKEYDPGGDYIYDARKYFNPEKYREIIAHQEEQKKRQQQRQQKFFYRAFSSTQKKFYYKAFCGRHNRLNTDRGYSSIHYVGVQRDRLSPLTSSPLNSEYPSHDIDELQNDHGHPVGRHQKAKKKSKHHSHSLEASARSSKRKKKADKKSANKKRKKKRKRHKPDNKHDSESLCHYRKSYSDKCHKKLRHRSRHKSKLFLSAELGAGVTNCDYSDSYHYSDQNPIGNDRNTSDPSHLSDNSFVDSYCQQRPYEDTNAASGSGDSESNFVNSAERGVVADNVADNHMWDEDSSASSEYSDVNKEFSTTDEENDRDKDY